MSTKHLVLGELTDFITGRTITDTLDERARQKIARHLVENKGYLKKDIETRHPLELTLDGDKGIAKVDFVIRLDRKAIAIVVFGPGSLVTRERSTLAAARLIEKYVVPFAMVTNGKDAHVLETQSSAVIANGLEGFPSREEAIKIIEDLTFETLSPDKLEKEKRILFAFEILAKRECDEFTCSLY